MNFPATPSPSMQPPLGHALRATRRVRVGLVRLVYVIGAFPDALIVWHGLGYFTGVAVVSLTPRSRSAGIPTRRSVSRSC